MVRDMETDEREFGRLIRAKRLLKGLSLAEASKASGVSKPNIWVLEEGSNTNPKVATVVALGRLYGIAPVTLFRVLTKEKGNV